MNFLSSIVPGIVSGFGMVNDAYNQLTRFKLPDETPEQKEAVEKQIRSVDSSKNMALIGIIISVAAILVGLGLLLSGVHSGAGASLLLSGLVGFWISYNVY